MNLRPFASISLCKPQNFISGDSRVERETVVGVVGLTRIMPSQAVASGQRQLLVHKLNIGKI